MKNATLNCLQSLCSLTFLKSDDLKRSSLHRLSNRSSVKSEPRAKVSTALPKLELSQNHSLLAHDGKKDPDSSAKLDKEKTGITEKDFRILQVLRSGKNYRIYLVKKENDGRVFAMRLIGRRKMEKNSINDQIALEKEILEKAKHPFIPKLEWYFENPKKIFFVMEYVEGGVTLKQMLKQLTRFSEEITRFYSAEILETLEYLHNELEVAYDCVKLRNFMLDQTGHIKLLDYSQAKRLTVPDSPTKELNSNCVLSTTTTKETTHSEEVSDLYGFGCLMYEMLTGNKPFREDDDLEQGKHEDRSPTNNLVWPSYVSGNAKDLVIRLINKEFGEKLSFSGIDEIKKHPFFSQVNWEKVINKQIYPPLFPSEYKDKENEEFEDEDSDDNNKNFRGLRKPSLETILENSSCAGSYQMEAVTFEKNFLSSLKNH